MLPNPPVSEIPLPSTLNGGEVASPIFTHLKSTALSLEEQRKAKKKARDAARYLANRERILACSKTYLAAYRAANQEKIRATTAAYYAANKEKCRAYTAAYRAANPEKIRAGKIKYERHRRKTDPLHRLTSNLRNRLNLAFKSQRAEKTLATFTLVGCTKEELRQHLVSQFREGMTLENHGKVWHIDHIRPCASFDLSDPNQATLCFHYSNLQPLFADENIRKGDRWKP
jgi:superfamily II DNA or RNA helicase